MARFYADSNIKTPTEILFWSVYSFWLSNGNDFILAKKIAILLPLSGNAFLLILVTALVGGIAEGIGGVFGKQMKEFF